MRAVEDSNWLGYMLVKESFTDKFRRIRKSVVYLRRLVTTGGACFAEGLYPSAKAQKPSAKALPRAALGKDPSGNF